MLLGSSLKPRSNGHDWVFLQGLGLMKCMNCDKAQCRVQTGPGSRRQKKNTDEYVHQIVGFQFKPKLSAVLAVLNGASVGLGVHS